MLDFIPDGYNEPGFIKAAPQIHGDFRFTFRPMLVEERSMILSERMGKLSEDEQERRMAAAVAARIVEWSLKDRRGGAVGVSPENVRRLKPALFRRLFYIVAGTEAPDVDPLWPSEDQAAAAELSSQIGDGRTAAAIIREERDTKN